MTPIPLDRRITLRDIALKLNLSQPTVSRALRNSSKISKAVIDRVQKTATAMGYRPDPYLSALNSYRLHKSAKPVVAELAWLNCWSDPRRLRSFKEFDLYWQGAYAEAERAGYRLEEFLCNDQMPPARLAGILKARNIQGLLIPPIDCALNWSNFDFDQFAVVRFGLGEEVPAAHRVTSDQFKVGVTLFQNAVRKGYQRIGFMAYRHPGQMPKRFVAGYLMAQTCVPPQRQIRPLYLLGGEEHLETQRIADWIKTHKIDAILTDVITTRSRLAEIGLKVPGDMAVAHTSLLDGGFNAGVDQNPEQIGRAAIQMLISLVNHHEFGLPEVQRELLVEGTWVDGSDMPDRGR